MADIAGALAAIEARFDALWTATPKAFENSPKPNVIDGNGLLKPWVYFEAFVTRAEIHGAGKPGDHVIVEIGDIVATVFTPFNTARSTGMAHAAAIGEIFRVKEFYQSAGACVRSWTPRVGRGEQTVSDNPNGNWWAVTVTIPFEFYHLA